MSVDERDIYSARLRACDPKVGFPYLSYGLNSMVPVFTEKVPTAAVDKWWRLYINPKFFGEISLEEGAHVLVHELWHLLGEHPDRCKRLGVPADEMEIWKIACEPEVNAHDELWKKLPGEPVTYKTLGIGEGLLAEEVFEIIRQRAIKIEILAPGPGSGECGSCAGGEEKDYELPPPSHVTGEAGNDNKTNREYIPGVSETRAKMIQEEIAHEIEKAAQTRGDIPAGWQRWAKKRLKPKVDYRKYLRQVIQGTVFSKTGSTWPNYRRPARRQHFNPDIIRPHYRDLMPQIAMIIDTSGSMSDTQVGQGLAEVDGALMALARKAEVTVYFTDAAAAPAQRVRTATSLRPIGGGGTDMGAGFQAIDEEIAKNPGSKPSVIVVVTDGYTPWPATPPSYATVIVVLVGSGSSAPWATLPRHYTIRLHQKELED